MVADELEWSLERPESGNQLEERSQNPFGHSPQDTNIEVVAHRSDDGPVAVVFHRRVDPGTKEAVQGNPPCPRNLPIQRQECRSGKGVDERADQNRRKYGGPGSQVVEPAEELRTREIHPDFLERLPAGGGLQIVVAPTPSAARKGEVTRPVIPLPLGPPDQENAVGVGRENGRDCCSRPVGLILDAGRTGGEPGREVRNPAQRECP
jgi:hypothetical protein